MSALQQTSLQKAQKARHVADKENDAPPLENVCQEMVQKLQDKLTDNKRLLRNSQRCYLRLKSKTQTLTREKQEVLRKVVAAEKEVERSAKKLSQVTEVAENEISRLQDQLTKQKEVHLHTTAVVRALKAKLWRAARIRQQMDQRVQKQLLYSRRQGSMKRVYDNEMRTIARLLVKSGCARERVGGVIQVIGGILGVSVRQRMSRRTVGRAILEGLVSAKVQLGYEISQAENLTISGDSTGHKNINYDARHIALRAPNYKVAAEPSQALDIVPKVRMLGVESSADQSSEASKKSWITKVTRVGETYMSSPLAQRSTVTFSIKHFASILRGMNGDHASKERRTAENLREWKRKIDFETRGEAKLGRLSLGELVGYLGTWKHRKILEIGGVGEWEGLSESERAQHEADILQDLKQTLGEEEYRQLSDEDRRSVDLFIWAGCCMHKDQNSFAGGIFRIYALPLIRSLHRFSALSRQH